MSRARGALASKATGFPIARVGAKLAVGYLLPELPNDITKTTPASFEPVLDYVVVKFPRFAFEKFPDVDPVLGVQMKSVGETMAIGRTFRAGWQKGLRGLEIDRPGWVTAERLEDDGLKADDRRPYSLRCAGPPRSGCSSSRGAIESGIPIHELHEATLIDPWFLDQLVGIVEMEREYAAASDATGDMLRCMKREGFGDQQLAMLRGEREEDVRQRRWDLGIRPTYNVVDTCAGEFPAETPYFYSSYEDEDEAEAGEGGGDG